MDLHLEQNRHLGYRYMSADRRLCLFHTLVFYLNGTDALLDRRECIDSPKSWTVDSLLNFFLYDILPWIELAVPELLSALLSRAGAIKDIHEYK